MQNCELEYLHWKYNHWFSYLSLLLFKMQEVKWKVQKKKNCSDRDVLGGKCRAGGEYIEQPCWNWSWQHEPAC